MKIEKFFKEIFYINLDSRPDRKQQFENEIAKYSFSNFVQRFSACIPKIDDVGDDYELLGYRKHGACGRSHKTLIEYAKNKNLENIFIFEDDAIFYNTTKNAIDIIENSLNTLSTISDWDLFYMGGIIIDEEINNPIDNLLKVDKILTTHAWGINKRCYDTILKYRPGDGYSKEFDSPIDGNVGLNTYLNKYLVYPLAVYQRPQIISDCGISKTGSGVKTGSVDEWLKNYNKNIKIGG
jgi:GR25 family glycosyltransferase involved in LPS biosynthesis